MTTNTDPVRAQDELRIQAALLRTPEFMAQFDPDKFAGQLERIAAALASAPVGVEDGPIDASDNAEYIEHCADRLERCGLRVTAGALRVIAHEHRSLTQQPAAPSVEAVAWLRMKPDGTPDWAEDCIGSDDMFLDHEMASDGYYLQPLYAAPQQPAGVMPDGISDDAIKTVWRAAMTSAHNVCVNRSNRWNDDDGPDDRITEANECAKEIAHWLEADEGFIAEIRAMLAAQQQGGRADG